MPIFVRILENAINWVKLVAYNINNRINLDYISLQLTFKWKLEKWLNRSLSI